jgi:hypothetical protein
METFINPARATFLSSKKSRDLEDGTRKTKLWIESKELSEAKSKGIKGNEEA